MAFLVVIQLVALLASPSFCQCGPRHAQLCVLLITVSKSFECCSA